MSTEITDSALCTTVTHTHPALVTLANVLTIIAAQLRGEMNGGYVVWNGLHETSIIT